LFVDTEDRRVLRRIQVQPDDVTQLFDQQRVVRQLERFASVRLQPKWVAPRIVDSNWIMGETGPQVSKVALSD